MRGGRRSHGAQYRARAIASVSVRAEPVEAFDELAANRFNSAFEPLVLREHRAPRLVVHLGLEGVAVLQRRGALRCGACVDGVEQALHVRQLLPGLVAERKGHRARPAPHGHVEQRVALAHHPRPIRQVRVEDLPVPPGFEVVAVDGIGDRLGRVVLEVHALAAEGPDARGDEHQPRQHRPAVLRRRQELAGLLRQVQQDRVAVEHGRRAVHDHRHLGVRVQRRERRQVLLALARVDRDGLVGQGGLFEEERDLHRVGGEGVVELEHGGGLSGGWCQGIVARWLVRCALGAFSGFIEKVQVNVFGVCPTPGD